MNEDILYQQYLSNNTESPISIEEFTSLKSIMSPEDFDNFVGLKKKENSQETPSSSSGLGENQPTPISAQGNPQITSVPISQDLDLNQSQIEAMQGVQNPASLNLELPQQSVNQNGLLESNGEVNTSSSALEDSFNNFIQEGGQLPLNPNSTKLNVLPRAYEEQFNNVTESAPQVSESENINTTNNDFVDFGNGITLPKELLPEEKTKEEFNKEIAESAKDITLNQSGKLETFDIENPKWISRNIGDLQGENYVNDILQKEKEGKVKVARNEKGELINKDLKPILDNSNVLWQPIGSYINDYNNDVNKFNKEIELNNQKVSKNNSLIESQNIRDVFLGKKEEPKSPLTTLYNKIYSDTGILLTEEQKAQFNTIDDVYNFYASEKAKKAVQDNPKLNYNEEYNKLINELNPKIDAQQSLQLGKNFVNNFLLGFRIEEEKSFNEARGYGAKIDQSYQKGYNSKDDLQEINFINNLSNNDYGLGLIGEWWNAVGKKEIGTTNYKINATLSTPEGRADVINSIANFINTRGSIQKELAYENIQRGKFNNQKNAKEGNVLALQDSINFIQSESNKINQIDKQQKEIYDFIDSWKKTQIRNNKKEQEFARTYSGYQSGEILPSIKIIAGNTVNGISDAVKSTIAGVAQLPNLAIGSDEYNDVISEIKKPSEFFGVKTSGMFSKYYDYKSGGKDIRFQNGNYYELVNGDYRPINLTYAQISNLGKAKEGEEFSIAGMIGDTTRMATEMGLAEFTGAVSLKGLSKFSQLRNIEMVSSVFGEESALTNSLQRLERFSKNPTNNGYFGWFTQTIADNYQEAKSKGMTNTQASVYGSVQSLLTSFLSRINPDVKFFKTYKEIDEKLIGSLLKNDKQGFLNNLKSLSNHIGGEISSETGQELTEQFAQELVRQFYNTSLTDKKFDTMTSNDVLKTVITTAITTGALTSSNLTLRGSGDNIVNYDNAYYNSTQLSEGQKLVMLANLNTSEIFKNFNNQFISDKNKLNEIEQTVKSVKTYLDKIPNKDKYTLNTQTKAVSLLYEIDQKRKELNKADESFKDDINNEINGLTDELKQLLNDDLKLQNEQPQQTTQPEQTQETAQGQTTETNVQPEQGTTTTEQGVSIDLNAKTGDTLYKTENTNKNIQDNGKKDTRTTVQEQSSGEKMLGNEQRSKENGQNTDLGLSSMGEQNQEQRQTTQQVEEVATNITEEEQEKINLERLNAYIEAKKQREQEQQVQVSPSEEVGNVQQNAPLNNNVGSEGDAEVRKQYNDAVAEEKNYRTRTGGDYKPSEHNRLRSKVTELGYKLGNIETEPKNDNPNVDLKGNPKEEWMFAYSDLPQWSENSLLEISAPTKDGIPRNQFDGGISFFEVKGSKFYGTVQDTPNNRTILKAVKAKILKTNDSPNVANKKAWAKEIIKNSEKIKTAVTDGRLSLSEANKILSEAGIETINSVQQTPTFSVNEQPQTIEQPSETQNAPLVSESKSTNGKYTIRVQPNSNTGIADAKIFDNNGNEVKLTNKQKEKYVAEHFAKQAYPETVVENMDKLRSDEYSRAIVDATNNPLELAQILDTENKFLPAESLNAKENAIANVIGNKVSRSSFIQFDDANNISFSIARGYGLTNKGKTIDVIAQEAEVFIYGDWDSQNPRVTTEDVIDFMKTYNNGAETFFTQPNQVYRDAEAKFEKLTGIKATKNALDVLLGKKTATKIDFAKLQEEADILSAEEKYNLRNEYNEWFNSLSLEDKNLELQKTYPYEQRTEENTNQSQNESVPNRQSESSKNVANQERDGATTEEINQVSPSPQYEGAVTYTQFGEGQEGTIYYDNGVAKIKDKAGKVYNANSPLVKNLKDAEGNAIKLQKSNERLTPITKQAFDALVTKLQKAFPRFAKVTYDFEAFKKQAEKLGATFNDIQRMVMAFHGSPHSFDKFTTDKIGTGEGAQAFGWGLYFTDLESIARNYAKVLSRNIIKKPKITFDGQVLSNLTAYKIETYTDQKQFENKSKLIEKIQSFLDDAIAEKKRYADNESLRTSMDKYIETYSNEIEALKKAKTYTYDKGRNLYKVSLHKGKKPSEYTWLVWDKAIPKKIQDIIDNSGVLNKEETLTLDEINRVYEQDGKWRISGVYGSVYNTKQDALSGLRNILQKPIKSAKDFYGEGLYNEISSILGGDKEASLFLLENGIDGIKYPAESISRGATSDNARGFNYVVFDENAVTIEDKIQFMQTPNGTIYGAKLPDGTIYLNPEFLNANTPIHEFSHLFEQLLPSRFKKGIELLKQTNLGKKLFEQLKQEGNYANLTDEQLWSEALNTHIGNFGENEVNNTKGKLKQLQDWIKDFFAKVGDVLGIKKLSPDTQLRMFTEGVVKDLLGGKPIVAENQVSQSEQVQYSFLTENDYDTNGNIKPKVLAEIQAEREAIKAEAQANGTFMKAPNGNATNLNEAQWIDVRTKRFKDWFGDWENDAENASKVVDENGEPLVVYHGSSSIEDINTFNISKLGENTGASSAMEGFFFTENRDLALTYFMSGDPDSYIEKRYENEVAMLEKRISEGDSEAIEELDDLESSYSEGWYNENILYDDKIVYPSFLNLRNPNEFNFNNGVYEDETFTSVLQNAKLNGNDSAILRNVTDPNENTSNIVYMNASYYREIIHDNYVAFFPNQIKSAIANVGTYSASNNDIRYSINSTTPLSVKEQTEVINELVANGEESAFAKLQETNWYKGLTDNQKQNINPTNIAETVINAVNANKRNLEQKVERRDAKIEKLQQEKDKVVKSLKDKIKELKSEYKDKIAELNESNKSFKEKFAEKVFWKRQAVNAIKLILKDKYIRKNVTDNDIIKLLNLSDRIFRDKDVNVAFENFEKYLDKVMSKEDAKEKRDKEKYDKIYNEVEAQFNNGVSLSEIVKSYEKDTDKERAKKAYYEIQGKSVTPEQAVEMMEKINKAEEEMLNPKKSFKDRLKTIRQGFNQKLLDRQWLPKQLLERAGAMDTFNRLINFGGASSKAKMLFDRAYRKIWFGLGIEDIKTLNNIIQNKRVISIAENRAKRGLDPINNTVSEITINAQGKNVVVKQMMTKDTAQAYLDGVKSKIGEKKFNKLSQRAEAYFAEFKNLLDALLDNGMIRQEAYDSMVEIDYQPRVFLEHLLDYDQKLSKEEQEFRNKTNGLTKDLIKQLDNGSEGALLSNSQLLLASAMNSRVQAIAMNDINKQFITKDFPKARIKFEAIDPKNFNDAEERRFYKYFKELDAKVIIPEGNTIDAKQGYSKAYYFENGVRKEFLLEDELHGLWHDKVRGLNPDMKQKLSYATGSSLLKGMATGYNPAFIIVNTPRDFLHTLSFSPEYRGVALWEGALLATDFARATAPFVGSIYKFNKGKDNLVRKYFEYGGGMDFLNQQGIAERDNVIRGTYQRLLKYLPQVVQDEMSADVVGKFLSTIALRPLSNYSELGFRIANFTRALENQLSDYNKDNKTKYKSIDEMPDKEIVNNIYHYAVSSTRGLLDFNQGGTFTKDAESVLPYINAGVQGTRAAVQAFRKDPIGVSTQVAQIVTITSVTFFGIGLYFIGTIRPDDEDEDKETLINNYLDFRESLTPEQKKNYFALPVGYNKADNSYEVLLVAKSQPLTPLFVLSEEISENILKRQVGKEEKSMNDIIASMGRAFSDNIDPTSLSTLFTGKGKTFADNVKTTAGKLASRNPFFKGVATALTGYDFYFNQPLQDTQSGKLSKFEGQSSNKVEQFYKDFGLASNFSPVRTKAFIESIVTSPTTNPYLGMFYAGSDAIFTDVTAKEAIRDFLGYNKQKEKWMFREMPVINRAIKETSDFSRQLNQAENIKADDEYIKALEETEYMRMKSDEIISEYLDKARNAQYQDEADDFVKQGLEVALIYAKDKYEDDPIRGKQFMDRAITKLQNYDTDGRVWDIKYSAENNPEAQALLIYSYFGDIMQNEDSERIIRSLKAAGLTSNSVMSYYQKIVDKNKK